MKVSTQRTPRWVISVIQFTAVSHQANHPEKMSQRPDATPHVT